MPPGLEKLLDKYNLTLDAEALLRELELSPESDDKATHFLNARCPLHKDDDKMSLRVDTRENQYKCSRKQCPGHAGGNLVRLFALARNLSLEDASLQIFKTFGLETSEETKVLKRNLYIAFSEKLTAEELSQAAKNMLLLAYKEYSRNLVIISRLINIYTREGDRKKACDYLLKAASIVAENKNYGSARTALKRVFASDPENEKARALLETVTISEWEDFYKSPSAPKGENSLLESLHGMSITSSLRVKLTEILLANKRPKMIESLYADLPEDLDDEQMEHLQKVATKIRKRTSSYENPVDALLLLADIMVKLGDYEPAKLALEEAMKAIDEGAPSDRAEEVRSRLKNFEDILLKKEYQHACALLQTGDYQAALASLQIPLEAGRINPEIVEKMIHCHFKLEQLSEAAKLCLALADLYTAQEKYNPAALALHRALLFQPGNQDTIIKLIETCKSIGDNDLAEQVAELAHRQILIESRPEVKEEPPPPPVREKPAREKPELEKPPETIPEKKETTISPTKGEAVEVQLPITLKFYTTSTSTDRITPVEALTTSISPDILVVNCGTIKIPGIQAASINYVLQNCQVMGQVTIPEKETPARIFGKIVKIQNRRINNTFQKIVTIEILDSDDDQKRPFDEFMARLYAGEVIPQPEPEPAMPQPEKTPGQKITRELLVSVRFLDDSGEEKSPDFFYANTMEIAEDKLTLNFGELIISGVPSHSLNYFLKNSILEMTIPLPEPNQTVRLMGQAKSVRNKTIRGKKSKIIEAEFSESPPRDRNVYLDYIKTIRRQ